MKREEFAREHIGALIALTNHQIRRAIEATIGGGNLSSIQIRLMNYLHHSAQMGVPVYQKDIEREFGIRRSSVTSVLTNLEKGGYVKRNSVDNDARLKQVTLTEEAAAKMDINIEKINDFEKSIMEGISEEEFDSLRTVLEKLRNNIERIRGKE